MPLEWELGLNSGPMVSGANQASAALQNLTSKLAGARSATLTLGKDGSASFSVLAEGAQKASGSITSSFGPAATAILAIGAALYKSVKLLDDFGNKAIEAFGERQGALRAYTTLLGDAKQATMEFAKAQQLSQKTDLTSAQVEGAQKSLMVAGFRGKELDQALLATADLGAMASPKERSMMVERVSRGLSQVKSKGKLQGEELMQLSEAGLSRGLILDELRGGKYGSDRAAVEKSLSGGKVGSDEGIAAIERALLKQFGTKKLGEYALGASGSLTSMLSNRDEGMQKVLKSFDAEEHIPSIGRYKEVLGEQAKMFDLATAEGRAFSLTIQGLSNTSVEVKTVWNEFLTSFAGSFSEAFNRATEELGLGQEAWKNTGAAAKELGATLGGNVATAVANLTHLMSELAPAFRVADIAVSTFSAVFRSFLNVVQLGYDALRSMDPLSGKSLKGSWASFLSTGDRIVNPERYARPALPPGADPESGIIWKTGSASAAADAGEADGKGYIAGLRAGTDTHSPSRAMQHLAQDLQAGFSQGMGDGIGSEGGGGAAGAQNFSAVFHVHSAATDPKEVANEVWERFARDLGRLARVPS